MTDPTSLQHAKELKSFIDDWLASQRLIKKVPVILVGNKADLQPRRAVSEREGLEAAEELHFQGFHEVSAVTGGLEVEQVFADLLQHMRAAKKEALKKEKALRRHTMHQLSGSSENLSEFVNSASPDASWQHQDMNTLQRVVAALKHLPFATPTPSPSVSRRTSPRSSPRASRILLPTELAVSPCQ